MRDRIAMLSGGGVKVEGFACIAGNAEAALIERSEVVLREGIATIGRGLVVGNSLGKILRNSVAVFEEVTEKKFGVRLFMSGASAKPVECDGVVDCGGVLLQEVLLEAVDRGRITGIGLGAKGGDGNGGSRGGFLCARKSSKRTNAQRSTPKASTREA